MSNWYYTQLFLQQGTQFITHPQQLIQLSDTLLIDYVQPWIETAKNQAWIDRSFFIRYAEGGYHVRLRMQGQPKQLRQHLQPFLQRAIAGFYMTYADTLGLPTSVTFPWLQTNQYVRVRDYEPEYAKYGGEAGMPLAEAHFDVSSQVALAVIAATRESGIPRGQYALDLISLMLQAYTANALEQAFILKGHTAYWLTQMPSSEQKRLQAVFENHFQKQKGRFARRLQHTCLQNQWPQPIPNPASLWREHLATHMAQLQQLERTGQLPSIVSPNYLNQQLWWQQFSTVQAMPTVGLLMLPNYIHMLCNRLGLSVMKEAQLAYLMYRTIETQQAKTIDVSPVQLEPKSGNSEKIFA